MTHETRRGRRAITVTIVVGMLTAFATLGWVGRAGAISNRGILVVVEYLLQFYLPMLGIVLGFYLAERTASSAAPAHTTSQPDALWISLFVIGAWVLTPTICLIAADTYNTAIALVDKVKLYGNTLSAAALAFYFSKGG